MLHLYLLTKELHLEKLSDLIGGISPCEVSPVRRTFLIFCCIVIVFGWIFSYIFLYLYFKYDDGYFTISELCFEYESRDSSKEIGVVESDDKFRGKWVDLAGIEETHNGGEFNTELH